MSNREQVLLDSLYLGVRDNTGFAAALEQLAELFDCPSAAFVDFDAASPDSSIFCSVGLFDDAARANYLTHFSAIDPAPAAFSRQPVGRASVASRIVPGKAAKDSAFLNDFYRPVGLEDCLGGTLVSGGGRFALIGLHRAPDRVDFSDDEIRYLERLMPHVSRALQLRRSFIALQERSNILAGVADRLPAGIIAFDEFGALITMNMAARTFASQRDGLALDRSGRLIASDTEGAAKIRAFQVQISNNGSSGGVCRVRRRDGPPYAVLVAPLPLEQQAGSNRKRGSLLVIHDPTLKQPSLIHAIKAIFDLGDPAARVVAAIFNGEDLRHYAEQNGVSINTAKFHLKTAFARLGVRSQSALTRAVAQALRDIESHRNREL